MSLSAARCNDDCAPGESIMGGGECIAEKFGDTTCTSVKGEPISDRVSSMETIFGIGA